MFLGTVIITIMYLGLTYSIAEMSPALPHTGGAYSFARTAFGPWGGFITGIAENVEYVLTPAVIVYFIGAYIAPAIFDTPAAFQPAWWILELRGVCHPQRARRRAVLHSHYHRHAAGDRRARHLFRQRHPVLRFRQIRDEYRCRSVDRRGDRAAGW